MQIRNMQQADRLRKPKGNPRIRQVKPIRLNEARVDSTTTGQKWSEEHSSRQCHLTQEYSTSKSTCRLFWRRNHLTLTPQRRRLAFRLRLVVFLLDGLPLFLVLRLYQIRAFLLFASFAVDNALAA